MSTKAISLQECLIIFAYIKFLASLNCKEEKSVLAGEKINPEKPHRVERVNRPIKRPRRKLTEVLAQAPEHNEYKEVDTGCPVGNEVW